MHLRSIKLAGFKSFVDPTTIELHRDISVIVGPNGCGKSNILDAVRWVIGESAAQRLRGEVIADFVFSGSDTRAPAQRASVELLFDNSEGRIGGEYASYSELEVRRDVTSEGPSNFYLNGARCRRRDIREVFLGTGFGTRGYSIIQQDWITQLVNSDPETMREHLEEAAGVSKYRERRHETINKLALTETNLEQIRLKQDELAKTIRQLRSQASRARRFDEYSKKLNAIKAHLLQGQLQEKESELVNSEADLQTTENKIAEIDSNSTKLQARLVEIESLEADQLTELDLAAEARVSSKTQVNSIVNELERLQQGRSTSLTGIETKCGQLSESLQTLDTDAAEFEQFVEKRKTQEEEGRLHEVALQESEELVRRRKAETEAADRKLAGLINRELELRTELATAVGTKQTSEATIANLSQLVENAEDPTLELNQIDASLAQTQEELATIEELERNSRTEFEEIVGSLRQRNEQLQKLRTNQNQDVERIRELHTELANCRAQLSVVLDSEPSTEELAAWLASEDLDVNERLGALLEVESGWESAVETVLKLHIQGIVSTDFDQRISNLDRLQSSNVTIVQDAAESIAVRTGVAAKLTPLSQKLQGRSIERFAALLDGVYACDKLTEARGFISELTSNESIVTGDGAWLNRHWIQVFRASQETSGVIELRSQSEDLTNEINRIQSSIDNRVAEIENAVATIEETTKSRDNAHQALSRVTAKQESQQGLLQQYQNRRDSKQKSVAGQQQSRVTHLARIKQLEQDIQQAGVTQASLEEAKETTKREIVLARQAVVDSSAALLTAESSFDSASQQALNSRLDLSQTNTNIAFLERSQTRQDVVVGRLLNDISTLIRQDAEARELIPSLTSRRQKAEESLAEIEDQFEGKNQKLRQTRSQLAEVRETIGDLSRRKDELTALRTGQTGKHAGLKVELRQLESEFAELGDPAVELADLDQDPEALEREQETLTNRIKQLGLINYRATSDLTEAETEKAELDRQVEDLESAVATLRNVIVRIDSETRRSLRTTFESVNTNLANLFSSLFGGGTAFLEFTDEDILQSGVLVRARPPGKRISTISMLSGGERAMTAIAFVFALFELNPSPVCILDEVDAPLDERNVSKFADLLSRMSVQTQFVVITHNPATMELAGNLLGVTMEEAGVSRLVAVDLEDAYVMAAN